MAIKITEQSKSLYKPKFTIYIKQSSTTQPLIHLSNEEINNMCTSVVRGA